MWQPRNDVAFRALFGEPSRRHLLQALLNAVLQDRAPTVPPIDGLEIENPAVTPDHVSGKAVILDVVAKAEDGRRFNVEIQLWQQPGYRARMLFYLAKRFGAQLGAGDAYERLKPAILVAFQGFASDDLPNFHTVIDLRTRGAWRRWSADLELHVLQLPRLPAFPADSKLDLTEAQAWGLFLALDDERDRERLAMAHSYLDEAQEAWMRLSADERLREEARIREGNLAAFAAARSEEREEGLEHARKTLVLVLEARGFVASNRVRQRILRCADPNQLQRWTQVAATATSLGEVFGS